MADRYGRVGGPFLDQIEAEARELKSAEIEGREPNFSQENLFPLDDLSTKEDPRWPTELVISESTALDAEIEAEQPAPPASEADAQPSEPVDPPPVQVETESETNSNEETEDDTFNFESSE